MTELELIAWLRTKAPRTGDDCAVIPFGSDDLLFTTDLMVQGVHFRDTHQPEAIGAKAVARSISDIAAMGGLPKWCLLSIAMPNGWPVQPFYEGVFAELARYGVELIGGDVSRGAQVTTDVTVCGAVPRGQALLRSGAKTGEGVYVSGPLGAAAAREYSIPPIPQARVALGIRLRGIATACMDISDGLSIDLHRLCLESGVACELDTVPAAESVTMEQALHGGEDYELLFTAPDAAAVGIPEAIQIGRVHAGLAGSVTLHGLPVPVAGHDHFAR